MCAFILLFRKFLLEYIYWVALRQLSFHDALSSVNLKKIFVHKPRVLLTSSQLTDPGLKWVWMSDFGFQTVTEMVGHSRCYFLIIKKVLGEWVSKAIQLSEEAYRRLKCAFSDCQTTASFHAFPLETVKPICSCSWLSLTTPVNTEGLKSASGPYVSVFY